MVLLVESRIGTNGHNEGKSDEEVALADQIDAVLATRKLAGEIIYKRDQKDPMRNGHTNGHVQDTFRVAPTTPILDARDDPDKLTEFMQDTAPKVGQNPRKFKAHRPPNPASGTLYTPKTTHEAEHDGAIHRAEIIYYPAGVFVDLSTTYRQGNFGGGEDQGYYPLLAHGKI